MIHLQLRIFNGTVFPLFTCILDIKLIVLIYFYTLDRGCTSKQGWQPHGNYLDSGNNQADDVYMSLKLPVKGFGSSEGIANPRQGQYGVVEFVFEMICEGECTFKFKEVNLMNQPYSINSQYSMLPRAVP